MPSHDDQMELTVQHQRDQVTFETYIWASQEQTIYASTAAIEAAHAVSIRGFLSRD